MSSVAMNQSAAGNPARRQRWLLLASLALNLFFVGVTIALLVRQPAASGPRDRSMSARIERLAQAVPPADAQKIRDEFQANRNAIETARANFDAARDAVRDSLRREPFVADAMRAAAAQRRAARQNYEQVLHGIIIGAAEKMSPEGRRDLADWRPDRPPKYPAK